MDWTVYLTAAFLVLAAAAAGAFAVGKRSNIRAASPVTPYNLVFAGLFLASYILLLPVYGLICEGTQLQGLKTALFALLGTIKVFTINADAEMVIENIPGSVGGIAPLYSEISRHVPSFEPSSTNRMRLSRETAPALISAYSFSVRRFVVSGRTSSSL